jgi:hypothetical protein
MTCRTMRRGLRGRRGSALILVLLMTLAVAALAVAAIFMSSSASLLSRFYDKERLFAYAAQSGIDRVVSRLQLDTTFAITSTTATSALDITSLVAADSSSISGVTVRVWAARTGDTTSSGPITISLLAQVADVNGTRFVRRVDLRRLHFGQWSLISNTGNASGNPFATSTMVAGRVHSNADWSTITQVSFRDSVTSTGTVSTTNAANIRTGKGENQRRIPWVHEDTLMARYWAGSVVGTDTLRFDINGGSYPPRVELVWVDLDADGVADREEGFVRIFEAADNSDYYYVDRIEARANGMTSGNTQYVDWENPTIQNQCGAFYLRGGKWQFFPVATHRVSWAWTIINAAGTPAAPASGNVSGSSTAVRNILSGPTARCFPTGSPYLVNTERFTTNAGVVSTASNATYPFGQQNAAHRYGGQDTTFTTTIRQCILDDEGDRCETGGGFDPIYTVGTWRTLSTVVGRESLRALDRNGRGAVLHFDGNIRLSGVTAGRVTIAAEGSVRIVDHLTNASGPNIADSDCSHLLGVVAEDYIRIEENMISHRTRVGTSNPQSTQVMLGGVNNFPLHGAFFSVGDYFGVEGNDFRQQNSNTSNCENTNLSMGCILHVGSAAMSVTRSFSTGTARGGKYLLTPDPCMESFGYRPPLFPETNRYKVLRSVDVRTAHAISDAARNAYFASLQGISDIP